MSGFARNAVLKLPAEHGDLKMYKCVRCGKDVDFEVGFRRIRCSFCGYKILVKRRTGEAKLIKAR